MAVKTHGEGAFNPGGSWPRAEGGVKWNEPPELASRLDALVTGGQSRWRGNFPAYALDRWGGKLPAAGLRVLALPGNDDERTLAWLSAMPAVGGVDWVIDPDDDGEERIRTLPSGAASSKTLWKDVDEGCEYHLIVADYALSRLPRIEECVGRLGRALAPGGLLVLRDYTGPDRFQFSDAQMRLVNAVLPLLPESRRFDAAGDVRGTQEAPPLAWVMNSDPRAAVNSQEVRVAVAAEFVVIEERELGGTFLMPLLAGIGQCFLDASGECRTLLDVLWNVERIFVEGGLLPSDHWFAVASKGRTRCRRDKAEGAFISRESAW